MGTRERLHLAALALLALLGVFVVAMTTRQGVGTLPDSAGYLSLASNLVEGKGYVGLWPVHAVAWPPLYAAVLGLASLLGSSPLVAARWLNAALLAANVVLVGSILMRHTRAAWLALVGATLVLTSKDVIYVHSIVLSGSLYTALSLAGVALLAAYVAHHRRGTLILSAILAASAVMTRYVGIALAGAGVIAALFLSRQPVKRRLSDAALFGVVSCLPLAAWLIRNATVAHTALGRPLSFYGYSSSRVLVPFRTIAGWFLPGWVPEQVAVVLAILALAGLCVLAVFGLRRWKPADGERAKTEGRALCLVIIVYCALYLGVNVLTQLFFEPFMQLDARRLAPLFPPLVVLIVLLARQTVWRPSGLRALRTVATVLVVLFVAWSASRAFWWVRWVSGEGLGFSDSSWRESPLMSQVKALPPDVPIISNGDRQIYLRTGRVASRLPAYYEFPDNEAGRQRRQVVAAVVDALRSGGVIVFFNRERIGRYLPSRETVEHSLPVRVRVTVADGIIYEFDPDSETATQ